VKIEEQRASRGNYAFDQPNQLFQNDAGKRFDEIRVADDPATALSDISRGVAFGDIDRNGTIDMVVSNNSGPARLLLNQGADDNAWVGLQLVGSQSPRSADGARVAVTDKAGMTRWRRVHSDGSYLSASDHALVIGLGDTRAAVDVGVIWPSGVREMWSEVAIDARHELLEGSGTPWEVP